MKGRAANEGKPTPPSSAVGTDAVKHYGTTRRTRSIAGREVSGPLAVGSRSTS